MDFSADACMLTSACANSDVSKDLQHNAGARNIVTSKSQIKGNKKKKRQMKIQSKFSGRRGPEALPVDSSRKRLIQDKESLQGFQNGLLKTKTNKLYMSR